MKFLYLIILSVFFMGCQSNDIKVPVNDNSGKHEIWDNSPVYILLKVSGQDTIADLKLGQTISTTKWLVAVDKRIRLKQLRPALEKVLQKRRKKSIHSDGKGKLFFTYLDSVQNKISFTEFTDMEIMPDFYRSQTYFKEYKLADKDFAKQHLIISQDKFVLNDSITLPINAGKKAVAKKIEEIGGEDNQLKHKLYLNFDQNLSFDRFLDYYTYFNKYPWKNMDVSSKIFIFTP